MSIRNEYLNQLMDRVIARDPNEPEFHQAVREVLTSLAPVCNAHPELITEGVMDSLVEPERTIKFRVPDDTTQEMKVILSAVYRSLNEKGYNPINQIVGYLLSEDPTYITNHNNARSLICKLDRDELLQELVRHYLFD